MIQVSFIIPLYNCLSLTQAMLVSLRATVPPAVPHEIIFVDDGSTDGTREWLSGLPQPCRFILNETNLGFAGACNRGAAISRGEEILFLNNDLVLKPRWLDPMLALLQRFPDAGLVGNVQRNFATGEIDHAGVFFNHQGKPAHATHVPLSTRCFGRPAFQKVAALTGACFGVRRDLWLKLGGFDEGFRNGGEDIDLCLRASDSGMTNYVALTSVVDHHISQSLGRKFRDEQNSERLTARWIKKIPLLSARAWSRQQIVTHADQSFVFDYTVVQAALVHYITGMSAPTPVLEGVRTAIAREQQRWRELLHGEIPTPPDYTRRTDLI